MNAKDNCASSAQKTIYFWSANPRNIQQKQILISNDPWVHWFYLTASTFISKDQIIFKII